MNEMEYSEAANKSLELIPHVGIGRFCMGWRAIQNEFGKIETIKGEAYMQWYELLDRMKGDENG